MTSLKICQSTTFGNLECTNSCVASSVEFFFTGNIEHAIEATTSALQVKDWRGKLKTFVYNGILKAELMDSVAIKAANTRQKLWEDCFDHGTPYILQNLFSRCYGLHFVDLALDACWRKLLKGFFVS